MKRTQSGFTLVELLVVISIIAILMGLLIPAVNAAREVARRNQCSTHVKNFALGAVQHENSKGSLPGWIKKYGVFEGGADRSDPLNGSGSAIPRHVKVGGWGVSLLPWLDAQPTYEHWTQDSYPIWHDGATDSLGNTSTIGASNSGAGFHSLAAPNLAIFQCPSNPVADANNGRNSYISNNGMAWIRTAEAAAPWSGTEAFIGTQSASQSKGNGTSKCEYLGSGTIAPAGFYDLGSKMKLDDLKDGQGFTAIYSENVQALPWYLPGFVDGPDLEVAAGVVDVDFATVANASASAAPPRPGKMIASQFSAGWVWHYEDEKLPSGMQSPAGVLPGVPVGAVFTRHRINGGGDNVSEDIFTLQMTLDNCVDLARPSSAHVDGVNCAFADGATRFVTQTVDYRVYQAIMTPRGKSADVPWPEFVLTDELGE